jgi:hypothetical protein
VLPQDVRFRTGPANVPAKEHDPNYSLYPRLTRAGLEYYGQPIDLLDGAVPSGRVEIDFLSVNPGGSESRPLLRLRLAYAQVKYDEWTFLAGQDWDVIAPLIPTINDNTLQWNNGNLGDRRPMFKLLWDHDLGGGAVLQFQNAAVLANALDPNDLDGNGYRDNEDSALPGYEGRLGVILPSGLVPCEKVIAGVWGLAAEEVTNTPIGGRTHFSSHGFGADLRLPLAECLTFQGEVWHGANLDDFRGGIGQGVNRTTGQEIEATGGWAELVYRPVSWYQGSLGFSFDDPVDGDLPAVGGRKLNYAWYVGNRFPLGSGLTVGLDYENWTTEYTGFHKGNASWVKLFVAQAF